MMRAALAFARRGIHVFPCVPGGKRPITLRGVLDATTDEETIRSWWERIPRANLAIAAGLSGLVILDFDRKGDVDGLASLAHLEERFGALPETLTAQTPSGGQHRYFLAPKGAEIRPSVGKVAPGIDVRAGSSYVVAPPSPGYVWTGRRAPVALPAAWVRALAPVQHPAPSTAPRAASTDASDVERRARAYVRAMPPSISGSGGHQAAWLAALALVKGFNLEPRSAYAILVEDFNPRCEPPWSARELAHKVRSAAEAHLPAGYLLHERDAA